MVSIDFLSSVSMRYIIFFSFLEILLVFNVWVSIMDFLLMLPSMGLLVIVIVVVEARK